MRVLHIIPDVNGGGASRATYRIHHALMQFGVQSELLVLEKTQDEPHVHAVNQGALGWLGRKWYKQKNRQFEKYFTNFQTENVATHSLGLTRRGILSKINQSAAEIVHLHWINHMLSIDDIAAIQKPIVWTFHDMWPFCGAEHYVMDDSPTSRFRVGYTDFNRPPYESGPDLNKMVWEHKLRSWSQKLFEIVCNSNWLLDCVKDSALFAGSRKQTIHYPLDLEHIYRPQPMADCRAFFQLPTDKKIVLSGAMDGIHNPYKGGDLLLASAHQLAKQQRSDIIFCVFGSNHQSRGDDWPLPVINVGRINDEQNLAKLYSSADLFVIPSRQEAFGQVASEAMACGTPVLAFGHGGPLDIVEHGVTGYLAKPYDPGDLVCGMEWILAQDADRDAQDPHCQIRKASRTRALALFSPELAAKRYLEVYRSALNS